MNKIEKLEPPVGCAFTGNSISAKVNELIDAVNEHECCINAHTEWINVSLNAQEPKALEECECPKYAFYKGKPRQMYHCEHEAKPQDSEEMIRPLAIAFDHLKPQEESKCVETSPEPGVVQLDCFRPQEEPFYGKGQFEKGSYEYEKQERENREMNEVLAQEEPKKCPPFHHMHTKDGDWSNLSLEEAKKEGITLYPCKKETEPKENIENWAHRIYNADTEYDAQELLKLFIKSQE